MAQCQVAFSCEFPQIRIALAAGRRIIAINLPVVGEAVCRTETQVAQTGSLLYRGLAIRRVFENPTFCRLPVGGHSRLPTCATKKNCTGRRPTDNRHPIFQLLGKPCAGQKLKCERY